MLKNVKVTGEIVVETKVIMDSLVKLGEDDKKKMGLIEKEPPKNKSKWILFLREQGYTKGEIVQIGKVGGWLKNPNMVYNVLSK